MASAVPVNGAGVVARQVAHLRASLRSTSQDADALARALDEVGRSLDRLRRTCGDDTDLVFRLGEPRAVAASYISATSHLTKSGVESQLCEDMLRRGQARVIEELTELQRTLTAPDRHAPGAR